MTNPHRLLAATGLKRRILSTVGESGTCREKLTLLLNKADFDKTKAKTHRGIWLNRRARSFAVIASDRVKDNVLLRGIGMTWGERGEEMRSGRWEEAVTLYFSGRATGFYHQ
jgi:hypothetical protein